MNIPIYRGLKLGTENEYVEGSYIQALQSIIPIELNVKVVMGAINIDAIELRKMRVIDPSTLSIKTPEIDFFMSLDVKTGRGGDIIQLQDGTKEIMECVFYRGRASYKDNAGRFHWCIHYKNVDVIGIQE